MSQRQLPLSPVESLALINCGTVILDLRTPDISSDFQRYQQEDAHEFQQALLDRLERCCLDSKTEDGMSTKSNIVDQVYGGRLVSKVWTRIFYLLSLFLLY